MSHFEKKIFLYFFGNFFFVEKLKNCNKVLKYFYTFFQSVII